MIFSGFGVQCGANSVTAAFLIDFAQIGGSNFSLKSQDLTMLFHAAGSV